MDAFGTSYLVAADRPLLGAVALVACLVGGTATHGGEKSAMTGIPVPVGKVNLAANWSAAPKADPLVRSLATKPALMSTVKLSSRALSSRSLAPALSPKASLAATRIDRPEQTATAAPAPTVSAPSTALAAAVPAFAALSATPAVSTTAVDMPETPSAELSTGSTGPVVAAADSLVPRLAPLAATAHPIDAEPLRLVNSPELRKFDLSNYRREPLKPTRLAQSRKGAAAASAKAHRTDRLIDDILYHQTTVSVAGKTSEGITVRIGPDMKPSIKVGDLVDLVSSQMDPDSVARFSMASSANEYVSFATLRSAGFEVKYDAANDSIAISASQ